jgi:UDP-3-O-[3-hydroxymyristoyl] N-acetylglucosamine deacetylase
MRGSPVAPAGGRRRSLRDEFGISGVGLHTGARVDVRVLPAEAGTGRRFIRMDMEGQPSIEARERAVGPSQLSTLLLGEAASVQTVEHVLSALAGFCIDDARIEVWGPEIPILDGSALPWAEAIARAGVREGEVFRGERPRIEEPLWVRSGDAFVAALPAGELRLTYGIDFPRPIGSQWRSFCPDRDDFMTEIAPARTFTLLEDVERLRAAKLIQGGSLDCAIVCGPDGWLNPPLRFEDEPVRHKLLDLLGDLSLLGHIPRAHFVCYKAGHRLHAEMARSIAAV